MNATRPNTMAILRPADVGAHCVRPREAKRLPYEFYWRVCCILQQALFKWRIENLEWIIRVPRFVGIRTLSNLRTPRPLR